MISSGGIVVEVGNKDVKQNGSFCCVRSRLASGSLQHSPGIGS